MYIISLVLSIAAFVYAVRFCLRLFHYAFVLIGAILKAVLLVETIAVILELICL